MIFRPHDYQRFAIREIVSKESAGLFLDMGLGKTVITLTALSELLALEAAHKVLVIAPLQTALNTWRDEVAKWDHLSHLKLSHVLGSAAQRSTALAEDADIYIINRENTQWLCEQYTPRDWPFDTLVIDELSSFKNASSKRFKALRKARPYISRVVGLTGTPAAAGYMDLWSEIYLLDRGRRLGETLGAYRMLYFTPGRRNGHIIYDWKLRNGAKQVIDDKLNDLCVSMKAEDWLKMPEKIEITKWVSMDAPQRALYDRLGRDSVLPEKDVIGATAAALQNKLLQMANGFVYDESGIAHHIHDLKIDALREIAEAAQSPVFVCYNYIADRERILKAFPDARVLKTPQDKTDWNEGRIPMLLAHPASAGHGLNLQMGGSNIVWFGLPWSLELYQQATVRLFRQGQKHTVFVYHILTRDTHDIDVLNALNAHNVTQEALLKALKKAIGGWTRHGKRHQQSA